MSKWTENDTHSYLKGVDDGLTKQEILQKYFPKKSLSALEKQITRKKLPRSQKWLKNDLLNLDLNLDNGLSLSKIRKKFLPNYKIKQLENRIKILNWNSSLYRWKLPFSNQNIKLAFTAGLILADAHFEKTHMISLKLAYKDIHILKFICNEFNLPYSKIQIKKNKFVRLNLSPVLGRLFRKHFKLHPEKSKGQVVFPDFLNDHCKKAFILGLFYGDGHYNPKNKTISFLSSKNFLKKLLMYAKNNKYFKTYTYNNIRKKLTQTPNFDLSELIFCGQDSIKFFRFLAEPSIMQQIPSLNRKIKDLMTCTLPRYKKPVKYKVWMSSDDFRLKTLLKRHRDWSYQKVSTAFPKRTYNSVYSRIRILKFDLQFPRIK